MEKPSFKTTFTNNLTDLGQGSHLCFIYENDDAYQAVVTQFIRLGLERGEKVLYITHERTPETILAYLTDIGFESGLRPLVTNGRFSIVRAEEICLKEGAFDPEALIGWFQDQIRQALDAGYPAVRVTLEASNISLTPESEAFSRFETRLDAWMRDKKALWLCQYDRRKIAPVFLLHALTAHPIVVIGTKVIENFYYIPPRESLGFDSEDTILDNWIRNLFKRKKAEEALESRIRLQQMITRLSASFVESGETGPKIDRALSDIGSFSGVDRAYLFQVRPDGLVLDNTHEWCAPGIEPQIENLQGIVIQEELPWFWEKMQAHETFHVPDVDDLPMEARLEQKHFEKQGIRSLVVIPILSGRKVRGFLGFDSVQQFKSWSENTISLLKITGQIIATFLDRTRIGEALKEEKTRYKTLTENLNIGVYRIATAPEDRFLEANPAMARIFGYETREEILKILPSKTFEDPESRIRLIEKLSAQGEVRNEELRLLMKDKTPFTASTSIVAVKNKAGQIEFFDGVIEDITERKRIEDTVFQSEKKFRDLFNAVNDLIYTQDMQGRFLSFNPALLQILGYTPDEIIGRPGSDFMKPEFKPFFQSEYLRQIREKGYHQGVSAYFAKDGRKVYLEYRSVLVTPEEGSPYISGIGRDATEKILAQRKIKGLQEQILQSKKMEAVGTLAGGIAHDFNNILGIILGNAELALEDVPGWNPTRHHLEEIRTASLRARDVVKHLLSFSRKTEQKRSPLMLSPLIKESLKLLRASIPADIAIVAELDEDSDAILGDPSQMHQVLINLCTNASQAMQENGGTLTLRLKNDSTDANRPEESVSMASGRYVKLTVSDTGSGIEAEHLDRIFDPYFTTKEVGKGTGLGLAVVHGIVKSHEGVIHVESRPEKGTTFTICFPAYAGEAESKDEKAERVPTGSERILFVDDEASIVGVGRQILERLGYRVESRTNPLEALALFSENPHRFDVVITDMTMPLMTGDRLTREILAVRPDMPVILATGFSQKIDADSAARVGVKCYIEKPFDRLNLAKIVREAVDGK